MKKHLLILFFIVCNVALAQSYEFANDSLNYTDENNLKQGHWVIFNSIKKLPGYSPDAKVEEGGYLDNKKQGIWKQYFSNGKLKNELTYNNNRTNGFARMYYENGNLAEEGIWKNNKWVGVYKYYHENGNIAKEWNHDETGKRVGVQKYFHENGKVAIEGEWKDGKESGVIKEYHPSGELKSEKNFSDGALDVASVKTFEMKLPAAKVEVVPQKQEPEFKPEPQKDPVNVTVFDGNGYNKVRNKEGQITKDGTFENGRLIDGKEYIYKDGKLDRTKTWKAGKVTEEKEGE